MNYARWRYVIVLLDIGGQHGASWPGQAVKLTCTTHRPRGLCLDWLSLSLCPSVRLSVHLCACSRKKLVASTAHRRCLKDWWLMRLWCGALSTRRPRSGVPSHTHTQ